MAAAAAFAALVAAAALAAAAAVGPAALTPLWVFVAAVYVTFGGAVVQPGVVGVAWTAATAAAFRAAVAPDKKRVVWGASARRPITAPTCAHYGAPYLFLLVLCGVYGVGFETQAFDTLQWILTTPGIFGDVRRMLNVVLGAYSVALGPRRAVDIRLSRIEKLVVLDMLAALGVLATWNPPAAIIGHAMDPTFRAWHQQLIAATGGGPAPLKLTWIRFHAVTAATLPLLAALAVNGVGSALVANPAVLAVTGVRYPPF